MKLNSDDYKTVHIFI